ncbi:hypothetical protein CsSME_00019229 [Camellia sinensis var. sinensis]
MNHFHICLLVASLLLFSPTAQAVQPTDISSLSAGNQTVFHASSSTPVDRGFESEKRKVPTGSNPLHNKR